MLYRTEEVPNEKEEFIFSAIPYNEDIDLHLMGAYQEELFEKGYLQEEHVKEFLNYAIYYTRKSVVNETESPYYSSLTGKCSYCASILDLYFRKLGLPCFQFNIGPTLGEESCHQLCMVEIPILKNEKVEKISFVLDPTFRQFCLKEENRIERYEEEPRGNVYKSTPHPGYFLALTKEGTELANNLITYGYFKANDENLKIYCDAFVLYFTPKEKYENPTHIGKIAKTNIDANNYREAIYNNKKTYNLDIAVETPIETICKSLNQGIKRFDKVNKLLLKKYHILLEKIKRNEINSYSIEKNI